MKRNPRWLTLWFCPVSTMTCIVGTWHNCTRFALVLFVFLSFDFVSRYLQKIIFPLSSNGYISSDPLFWRVPHTGNPVVRCACLFQPTCLSCSERFSHITTVGSSPPPHKNICPCPADWKKGGADIPASPLNFWHYWSSVVLVILPTLVICIQLPQTLLFV